MTKRVILSWSSGKDSAWSLYLLQQDPDVELVGLLTTFSSQLDKGFSGRHFDDNFLQELPVSTDPCGENGEFHTVVIAGPMFSHTIAVEVGETVERDGFIYTDVVPLSDSAQSLK